MGENMLKEKKSTLDIENEIKSRIKIVFQKDLNNIPYKEVQEFFKEKIEYEKIKIEMLLLADKILNKIPYSQIQNLNYKAFTAGLIYYVGQSLENRKIFTQSLIEKYSKFSSTTIRKKYHILKDLLGDPQEFKP